MNSFQMGFHDSPRRRQEYDCESDDFDIIFEDSSNNSTSYDAYEDSDVSTESESEDSDSDGLVRKKVRFSQNPPKVHVMHVWLFAAKQTRVCYWQQFAVDRERFKRRIAEIDKAVSWVLKPQHRARIECQRFMPWWNAQESKEIANKKEKDSQDKLKEDERLKNEDIEGQNESTEEKSVNDENKDRCMPEEEST